jgi:hypothetical protein
MGYSKQPVRGFPTARGYTEFAGVAASVVWFHEIPLTPLTAPVNLVAGGQREPNIALAAL